MSEYLEQVESKMLYNLLRYPPSEGSREAHEAWKQNVRFLLQHGGTDIMQRELKRSGFVSVSLRNDCIGYAKALPFEK